MGNRRQPNMSTEEDVAKINEIETQQETQIVDAKAKMREMKAAAKAEKTRLKAEVKEAKRVAKLASTPPASLALMLEKAELEAEHEQDVADIMAEIEELKSYVSAQ